NQLRRPAAIDKFKIQHISTNIGRKEVEEFGIMNLPTRLNAFQLIKRNICAIADQKGLWNEMQQYAVELLKEAESIIINSNSSTWKYVHLIRSESINYVKNQLNMLIYIGESSDVGERITTHN